MKNDKLELLAPAGSFESLKAAVTNGADAVYLGGGKFNARVNAGNFTEEDLSKALDYAHERGVRVYITLNTLLKNGELEEALQFAAFAYQQGADAVLVQDPGLLSLIRKNIPHLTLHSSTQMTLTNSSSIHAFENLGVKRVVLARELSLQEIQFISAQSEMELEVFVHGALCVSYSGQCLMSSFIGGRSGNRGTCAQPCRLPWSLSRHGDNYGKTAYLLSPRDLMAIDFLPQLKKVGVTSLKLEGRMKSPEYVAIVTSIYRKYLNVLELNGEQDYKVEEADRERLLQAFNRGGFTQSYLKGDRDFKKLVYTRHPKNQGIYLGTVVDSKPLYVNISLDKPLHMGDGIEIMDEDTGPQSFIVTDILQNGAHVRFTEAGTAPWVGDIKTSVNKGNQVYRTLSKPLFEEARLTYERGEGDLVPLDMYLTLKTGEAVQLRVTDDEENSITVKSEIFAEKALNKALSMERIQEQLQKTGDTPYWLRNLQVDTDQLSTIPVSALNALRRAALEEIKNQRIGKMKKSLLFNFDNLKPTSNRNVPQENLTHKLVHEDFSSNRLALSAYFYELPRTLKAFDGLVARVYLPATNRKNLEKLRQEFKGELFLWTPSILKDAELTEVRKALIEVSNLWDGLTYGNLGALQAFKTDFPQKAFCAEYSMNLFNDEALALQKSLGAQTGVLSPELRLSEVEAFSPSKLLLEAFVYGRIPLMTMEHCPAALEAGCTGLCATCARSRGYLKDRKGEVFPFARDTVLKRTQIFNAFPLFMDDTSILKDTPLSLLRLAFTTEELSTCEAITRHYFNKLRGQNESDPQKKKFIQDQKDKGFTKGHWFRGV